MTDLIIPQHFEQIAYKLRKLSGFNPESLGWSNFHNIIKRRMQACSIDELKHYSNLLENSNVERDALIEAIVIPETWFFRDASSFYALKHIVVNWQHNAVNPLRILSLPCATGEEPYSIAIALREVGLVPHQFHIDAVDISTTAITKAMQGIYTENAFRNNTIDFTNQYFIKTSQGYKLVDTICSNVNFSVNNFFTYYAALPYNIIFCRNLLIYFDQEIRNQAFIHLHTMLTTNGLLFLGHSESIQAIYHGWNATNYAGVFRKKDVFRV